MLVSEEEKQDMLAEAKIFAIVSPTIIPLLHKRKKVAMDRLLSKYQNGQTDYLTLISEIAVLTDLEREITSKAETYSILEGMQHGNPRNHRNKINP
jgi:hypothetical protein